MAMTAAEPVPALTTMELRLPLSTAEISLSPSPMRRIISGNPEEIFMGAAHHYNRQAGEMDSAAGAYLMEGYDRGLFDPLNQEPLQRGIAVMLNKIRKTPSAANEASQVLPERQLDYLLTTRRRWLMKSLLAQAFTTYEYQFDYFGFFSGVGARPTAGDAGLNDYKRWEFGSKEQADGFGRQFGALIASPRFTDQDSESVKKYAKMPDLSGSEVAQAGFSLFLLNNIFPAGDPDKRNERRIAMSQLGLPTEICSVTLNEDFEHTPVWVHVGKFMTNFSSGFIRSHKQLYDYCGK